ncbi:hypothetical protein HPB48_017799 [Haemaphysalis longicornis]|uniref:At5g54830-like domain-containing protein n=1 Tax=Haemaphysalis longicornis TaxID=44386 RepID=A0A9J6FLE6_HAELO|nr:hypothetical protein HPB48_017799 [Haemaphysalis longicornis]
MIGGKDRVNACDMCCRIRSKHSLLTAPVFFFDGCRRTGRYCEWKYRSTAEDGDAARTWADYKRTLKLECDSGQPGTFTWTPDEKTPDLVYYQCFTHYYLGWKILVTDPRQPDRALSEEPSGGGKAATAAAVLVVALGAIASRAA